MTDFEKFQKVFKGYQKKFGLTGYKVYFQYKPIEDFADIIVDWENKVATARLNSALPSKDKPFKHIHVSAKHEAIHLLLNRLESCAFRRYTTETDISEAVEELTFKLEDLIE